MHDTLDPNAGIAKVCRAKATAKLLWPQERLASCMPTGVVRDTRGANLPFNDRFNSFSTSPYCAISWILQGNCRVATDGENMVPNQWPELPEVVVSGPTQTPTISWNNGDVYAVTLGFLPDAFYALTGIEVSSITDKNFDATELLPAEFEPCFKVFTPNGNIDLEFLDLQNLLAPIWEHRRPKHAVLPNGLFDWANRSLSQLATNGVGRSARQLQRRIKQWTGLSHRQIAAHARGEELYKSFLEKRGKGDINLSQIALENGYADQSHLGRDVKRITGLSPKQLDQMFDEEERFWYYRLLRDFY